MTPLPSFDLTRPTAMWTLDGSTVADERVLDVSTGAVRDLALVVLSAEAVGGARWCLDAAAEHARTREQFGRPIGQFQGVKHRLADMLVTVEQGVAATWDAAMVLEAEGGTTSGEENDQGSLAVQLAAALALDGYVESAKGAIQVLGGMGFTWEHDAHIHLRRATTLRQLVGGTAPLRAESARLALAGWRRRLTIDLPPEAEALRAEVGRQVATIAAIEDPTERQRALADNGLLAPHWPSPWGRDAGAIEQLVIDQACAEAGLKRPNLAVAAWALPTIMAHGTAEQTERFVGATLRGEIIWCQLFSEPGAGSDLAALSTRATRVDGGWSLTGQKVWTSVATRAHWGICLARTNPDVPKHRGITYFLVDMHSPGIDIRPLREITGAALFNEVFFDDCFVPDECVVGEIDGGWKLARTTLANERVSLSTESAFGGSLEAVLDRVAVASRPPGPRHPRPPRSPALRGPVAGPAGHAGHAAVGGRAPARVRVERAQAARCRVRSTGPRVRARHLRTRGRGHRRRCRRLGLHGPPDQVPDHRRRHQRGPAQRDRRAPARPAPGPRARPVTTRASGRGGHMTLSRGTDGSVGGTLAERDRTSRWGRREADRWPLEEGPGHG